MNPRLAEKCQSPPELSNALGDVRFGLPRIIVAQCRVVAAAHLENCHWLGLPFGEETNVVSIERCYDLEQLSVIPQVPSPFASCKLQ